MYDRGGLWASPASAPAASSGSEGLKQEVERRLGRSDIPVIGSFLCV